MKTLIMVCALRSLGVLPKTTTTLANHECHFYDVINEHNLPLMWQSLTGRHSAKSVQQLEAAQRAWHANPDSGQLTDAIWFLRASGLDEKTLEALDRKAIRTVTQITRLIQTQQELPLRWRKQAESNETKLKHHATWVRFNGDLIEHELQRHPQIDLSTRLEEDHQRTKLMKSLGISTVPTTLSALLALDFNKKDFLVSRLAGETLREIGDRHALTRERVRQIIAKLIKKLPLFDDVEAYKTLVLNYDVSLDDFLHYTNGTQAIYNYLLLKYKRQSDLKSLDQYLLTSKRIAPEVLTEKLDRNHKFINHDNQIVEIVPSNVIDEILFRQREVLDYPALLTALERFYDQHNQDETPQLTNRAIDAQLSRQPNAIKRTNGHFRYYPHTLIDVMDYVDELNELLNVPAGIYGIQYFVNLNAALMTELDIQTGDELANLLKTIGYQRFPRLNTIVRQSQVYIGRIQNDAMGRSDFYTALLKQFNGRSLDELVDYLQVNYCFHRGSVWGYLAKNYAKYLHNGQIMVSVPLPTDSAFYPRVTALLKEPIYTYEQMTDLIKTVDAQVEPSPVLLDQLGYTERSGMMIKKPLTSLERAFDCYCAIRDSLTSEEINAYHNRGFNQRVYTLELQHELLAVAPGRYLTKRRLVTLGVTDEAIDQFLAEVQTFVKKDVFFTWHSLRASGFESDFIRRYDLSDYAYQRLIFTIPSVRTIKTADMVFVNKSQPQPASPALTEFLRQVLGARSCDLDTLLTEIKQRFGLRLERSRVIDKVGQSELAYSPETRRLYGNATEMYADVYRDVQL